MAYINLLNLSYNPIFYRFVWNCLLFYWVPLILIVYLNILGLSRLSANILFYIIFKVTVRPVVLTTTHEELPPAHHWTFRQFKVLHQWVVFDKHVNKYSFPNKTSKQPYFSRPRHMLLRFLVEHSLSPPFNPFSMLVSHHESAVF